MARPRLTVFVLGIMILALVPYSVQGEDSGGVQASASTVAILPQNPVEGGEVTIRLTLSNINSLPANDVLYKFYWDGVEPGRLLKAATVDIDGSSTVDVDVTKSGLTAGEHQIWVIFDYNSAGEQMFYKTITVAGLPNLEVTDFQTSPSTVNAGDDVSVAVEVTNTGSEDAGGSEVKIDLGSESQVVQIPALDAGNSTWANITMTAPDSGDHDITATVDLNDNVTEGVEENEFTSVFTVTPRMDIVHVGDLQVSVDKNSLTGPWFISGTIERIGGNGETVVPMRLEILDETQQSLPTQLFDVTINGGANAQKSWTYQINYTDLANVNPGNHLVTAIIDPYQTGGFIQESTDNDRVDIYIEKFEVPDVSIDANAIPSKIRLDSGDSVTWKVVIINSGQIPVKGKLVYTWDGIEYDEGASGELSILAGESYVWERTLQPNNVGSYNASFLAEWFTADGYYDSNPLNSYAQGEVQYLEQLRLVWSRASMSLVDENGDNATTPFDAGKKYTISVNSISQESGSVNYSCEDELGSQFELIPITVANSGEFVKIECTFTASAPYTNVIIKPDDPGVSDPIDWSFDTKEDSSNIADEAGDISFATAGLIAVIALVMIGILVAAIILTRDREEEVDRDIFDYCPACDGQLEGSEDRCPYCSFNLKKARRQFHDCESCGESIPDLLENCPYCGAEQDTGKYFERRERRVVEREEIALPEEEEVDPETIHATGYEDFDEAIKEFGYESDDLEGDWDDSIAQAEAEVEAAYDRKIAIEESQELDDEEAMSMYTTTLKSIEETFESHDIDAILKDKDIQTHDVEDVDDLSASDASIRAKLYEITGEEGVMPGDDVMIGMGIQDRSLAGNALPEDAIDFSFDDEDDQLNPVKSATEENTRRRNLRRRSKKPEVKTAECGACGSEIPVDAKECPVCGAKFE